MTILNKSVTIGTMEFMELEIENVEVVSAYPGKEKLVNNYAAFSPLWRRVFGTHSHVKGYDESFMTTRLKSRFFIRYDKSEDLDLKETSYNTYIYGGSINMDYPDSEYNEKFLQAQIDSIKESIQKQQFQKNPSRQMNSVFNPVHS